MVGACGWSRACHHRPARSLHNGYLYPEADAALCDRLDVLYGAARPTLEGPSFGCAGRLVLAPVGPRNNESAADGGSATL